jgi:hypothetical protein
MRVVKPPTGAIDLSVVVVVQVNKAHLDRCLEALTHSETSGNFEVIIPLDESLSRMARFEARYPAWHFVRNPGIRSPGQLRSDGIRAARGRLVALTEDRCIPATDWVQRILDAHAATPLAIGGIVDKARPDEPLNWSAYFLDHLHYMPPVARGRTLALSALNASYKLEALHAIADAWRDGFAVNVVNGTLAARGGTVWLSPDIRVYQRHDQELEQALWERYSHGRRISSARGAALPPARRIARALPAPALPFLRIARLLPVLLRKRRRGWQFLAALPGIALLAGAAAWGELLGLTTGRPETRMQERPDPEYDR